MDPSEHDGVVLKRHGSVAELTIDRPLSRNTLDESVRRSFSAHLTGLAQDGGVRALVLTGGGTRTFAAGADVRELRAYTSRDGLIGYLQGLCNEIEQFPIPTVAAINGHALGGGCEVALACDIRIASRTARLGFPETGLGIIPGAGGTQRMARVVGAGRALEMILTGRIISADEALTMGLVTAVAAPDELMTEARATAHAVAAKGPLATNLARLVVRSGLDTDQRTGQTIERLAQALLHETADKQEGISAMLEKRTPRFTAE